MPQILIIKQPNKEFFLEFGFQQIFKAAQGEKTYFFHNHPHITFSLQVLQQAILSYLWGITSKWNINTFFRIPKSGKKTCKLV